MLSHYRSVIYFLLFHTLPLDYIFSLDKCKCLSELSNSLRANSVRFLFQCSLSAVTCKNVSQWSIHCVCSYDTHNIKNLPLKFKLVYGSSSLNDDIYDLYTRIWNCWKSKILVIELNSQLFYVPSYNLFAVVKGKTPVLMQHCHEDV
jgi:hypothetical protein